MGARPAVRRQLANRSDIVMVFAGALSCCAGPACGRAQNAAKVLARDTGRRRAWRPAARLRVPCQLRSNNLRAKQTLRGGARNPTGQEGLAHSRAAARRARAARWPCGHGRMRRPARSGAPASMRARMMWSTVTRTAFSPGGWRSRTRVRGGGRRRRRRKSGYSAQTAACGERRASAPGQPRSCAAAQCRLFGALRVDIKQRCRRRANLDRS